MYTLVDHHLNLIPFHHDDWRIIGNVRDAMGVVEIRRHANGSWCKGRPRMPLYHAQSIHQIWDLYIQAGMLPPPELIADTCADKRRAQEEAGQMSDKAGRVAEAVKQAMTQVEEEDAPAKPASKKTRKRS